MHAALEHCPLSVGNSEMHTLLHLLNHSTTPMPQKLALRVYTAAISLGLVLRGPVRKKRRTMQERHASMTIQSTARD